MSAAGAPTLLEPAAEPVPQPLLTADSPAIQPTSRVPAWGIYRNGQLAIEADSILKVEFKGLARISNAPQEEGAFLSFNKVQAPYESRVQMTKGGSESDRASFLSALEASKKSLNLYDIVMPEKQFMNANLTGYTFTRTARSGVTLLTIDAVFEEVRQAAAPRFTSTTGGGSGGSSPVVAPKNATGADPVNGGIQQPTAPTAAQMAPVKKVLAPAQAAGAPSS